MKTDNFTIHPTEQMVPPGEQPDGYSFPDYMYRFLF